MKKLICSIMIILLIAINFIGCDPKMSDKNATSTNVDMTDISEGTISSTDEAWLAERNCRLIVNGKDITENNYVRINSAYSARIPLLITMKTLGADVTKEENIVTINHNEKSVTLDISSFYLGILVPPGGEGFREIINGDLIFDDASVRGLLKNMVNAEISIDCDNMIVYINTINT